MFAAAAFLSAALIPAYASSATQSAVITNSGSTNTAGYTIDVSSDGSATLAARARMAAAPPAPKKFTIPAGVATQFFADLKSARDANIAGGHCMKSASFGTTTHVNWDGWTSPDLECPAGDAASTALERDVRAIVAASGLYATPAPAST
jgi:hypothetical protein